MIARLIRAALWCERNLVLLTWAVMVALLALSCCSRPAVAQVVRVANLAPVPYSGWKRTTIDVAPPRQVGRVGDVVFVQGRRAGLDVWCVDLLVTLAAGETRAIDLATAEAFDWSRAPLPADPLAWFGGVARIGGSLLPLVELQADGAGYTAHLRARTGRMLCADLWLTWYPDRPGWAVGELMLTASNPGVPDMGETLPADLVLSFGDAVALAPGSPAFGAGVITAGTRWADGQARAFPIAFVWLRHLRLATDWASVGAVSMCGIGAVGIRQLLADGNPLVPAGCSARAWATPLFAESLRRLHTWEPGLVGPAPQSGATGAQEDQVFVRGEPLLADGVGTEWIALAGAMRMAARPCHHLEADGAPLDLDRHPQLRFWDGRAHWHTGVSPDQLGKPRSLSIDETAGWWGPDVEHWLLNTLAAASRLTGSPALQHLLGAQARVYLLQWTVAPGLSTSQTYAARAVGWEGIGVVHLWRALEDRALAARVRDRWLQRLDAILLPQLGAKPNDIWDVRVDDARLGAGAWWIPWQQSVGAYGLDFAGAVFARADARAVALRAAQRVLADAWVRDGTQWLTRPQMAVAGGGPADGSFDLFGMPLAVAVVLRGSPASAPEPASSIWAWLLGQTAGGDMHARSWIAPGVR